MKYLYFILFTLICPPCLALSPPNSDDLSIAEEEELLLNETLLSLDDYLLLHQRLKTLFAGLYGPAHTLEPYLNTLQQLVYHYAQNQKRLITRGTRISRAETQAFDELEQTLKDLKEHGNRLLGNFRVENNGGTGENSSNLPTDTEWAALVPPSTPTGVPWEISPQQNKSGQTLAQQPTATVTPITSTAQQDESFRAFFGSMQAAQVQHPQYTGLPYRPPPTIRDYLLLFAGGCGIILGIYFFLKHKLTPDMQALEQTRDKLKDRYPLMAEAIRSNLLPKAMSIANGMERT